MDALSMPSTPVLIYGAFVVVFIIVALFLGRAIDEAKKETDDWIREHLKRR